MGLVMGGKVYYSRVQGEDNVVATKRWISIRSDKGVHTLRYKNRKI